MTCQAGYGSWPPALIGNFKFSGTTDCKSWNQVEVERCGVIVVDEENDIGRMVLYPFFGELVPAKNLLPVRLLLFSCVPRGADRGNMRGVDGRANSGHGQPFDFRPGAPCGWRCACASPFSPMN